MEAGGEGMGGEESGICANLAAASQRGRVGKAADAGERQAEAARRERAAELGLETFLLDRLLRLVTVVLEPDLDLRGEGFNK